MDKPLERGNTTNFEGNVLGSCNGFTGNYSLSWPSWSVKVTYNGGSDDWTGISVTLVISVPEPAVVWGSVQLFMFCKLGSNVTLGPGSAIESLEETCSIPSMSLSLIVQKINNSKVYFMHIRKT